MMELLEDVFIRCSRCGKVTGIHKEDFDFESYVYDRGDNRMGEEIEFRHEGYIECDQCDNEISFRISGYEYPIGAFNYVPYKIGKLQIQGFSEPTTPNKIKQSYHITQKAARSRPRAAFLRGKLGRRQDFSKK